MRTSIGKYDYIIIYNRNIHGPYWAIKLNTDRLIFVYWVNSRNLTFQELIFQNQHIWRTSNDISYRFYVDDIQLYMSSLQLHITSPARVSRQSSPTQ